VPGAFLIDWLCIFMCWFHLWWCGCAWIIFNWL